MGKEQHIQDVLGKVPDDTHTNTRESFE